MAKGLPAFFVETHLDTKFRLIEARNGLTGYAVVLKLLSKIYGEEGYYMMWSDEISELFAAENHISKTKLDKIVQSKSAELC